MKVYHYSAYDGIFELIQRGEHVEIACLEHEDPPILKDSYFGIFENDRMHQFNTLEEAKDHIGDQPVEIINIDLLWRDWKDLCAY